TEGASVNRCRRRSRLGSEREAPATALCERHSISSNRHSDLQRNPVPLRLLQYDAATAPTASPPCRAEYVHLGCGLAHKTVTLTQTDQNTAKSSCGWPYVL